MEEGLRHRATKVTYRHSGARVKRASPESRDSASGPSDHPGMTLLLSPAPHRRHQHLVAAAGAAVDFLAGAELQVLAQADPDFTEPPAVAGHRDGRTAQARIDLDE